MSLPLPESDEPYDQHVRGRCLRKSHGKGRKAAKQKDLETKMVGWYRKKNTKKIKSKCTNARKKSRGKTRKRETIEKILRGTDRVRSQEKTRALGSRSRGGIGPQTFENENDHFHEQTYAFRKRKEV